MSISDLIVVMKDGIIQQIDPPQRVYDSPVNLFVAKFLGTPSVNVFRGEVRGGRLLLGEDDVLPAGNLPDGEVLAAIRPEGFIPQSDGPLRCAFQSVEVMGRDISVVSAHAASLNPTIRSIVSAENEIDAGTETVRFALKPNKVYIFDRDTEERLYGAE